MFHSTLNISFRLGNCFIVAAVSRTRVAGLRAEYVISTQSPNRLVAVAYSFMKVAYSLVIVAYSLMIVAYGLIKIAYSRVIAAYSL